MNRPSQSGLTLPEMLISIAILAMIMAAITPLLRSTNESAERVKALAALSEDQRSARQILDYLTEGAILSEETDEPVKAKGSLRQFSFYGYDHQAWPSIITLKPNLSNSGFNLIVERAHGAPQPVYEAELLPHVSEVTFAYYGALIRNQDAKWQETWDLRRPPKLLRINGNSANGPFVMDLVMSGQVPLVCEYDPVSRICRNGV